MDFLFQFLDHFVGEDTDPIDLLPLIVLACLVVGVRHIRSLILTVLKEIGELKAHIDLFKQIQELKGDKK